MNNFGSERHVVLVTATVWLVFGTVIEEHETPYGKVMTLKDCGWVESVGAGHGVMDLCSATTAKQQREIATTCWPMPDGTTIVGIASICPAVRHFKALHMAREADAVREAGS